AAAGRGRAGAKEFMRESRWYGPPNSGLGQRRPRDSHSVVGSGVAGVSGEHAAADRLAARADPGGNRKIPNPKSQNPNPNRVSLGFGAWDFELGIYFFAASAGVGRSEYDVRDHTFTPSRLV